MGMPRTLKNFMLFNEGNVYQGEAKSVTLPTLTRKMEEWRGGGMNGPGKMDMGMEALELEATFGGPMRDILRQWGVARMDGVYMRFVGSYQRDDTGSVDTVEVIVRGRHEEIDMGDAEAGEVSEFKVKTAVAYYKLVWNGRTDIEIDFANMIETINGIDRTAELRASLGIY